MIPKIDNCDVYDAVMLLHQKKLERIERIERQYPSTEMPEEQREEQERLRDWLSEVEQSLAVHRLECDTRHGSIAQAVAESIPSNWYRRPGVIYFVAAGSPPVAIKIGVTQSLTLNHRLRALQTSNHERIRLLGIVAFDDGEEPLRRAEAREQEIHRQFEHLRIGPAGTVGCEWFKPASELLEFIKQYPPPVTPIQAP
jgi:hypothetical protein